jgi:hypothetical protein
MTHEATFTKRIGASRENCVIWIPKDVVTLLQLKKTDIIEVRIKKLRGEPQSY